MTTQKDLDTLSALKGLRAQWYALAYYNEPIDKYPLCDFNKSCKDCVIFKKTGVENCWETPMDERLEHYLIIHAEYEIDRRRNDYLFWKGIAPPKINYCKTCTEKAKKAYDWLDELTEVEGVKLISL